MAISEAERKARKNARARAARAANPEKYRQKEKAIYLANPEGKRAANQRRYAKHGDTLRKRSSEYRRLNPEKKRAQDKRYAAENSEKIRIARNARYAANPQGQAVRGKRYVKNHPEVPRRAASKYRAMKLKATVGDTNLITEWEATWKSKKTVSCYWCRKRVKTSRVHVDHVVPLSKGGEHSVDNLCVSCERCNLTKQAKLPEEFVKTIKQPLLFVRMD